MEATFQAGTVADQQKILIGLCFHIVAGDGLLAGTDIKGIDTRKIQGQKIMVSSQKTSPGTGYRHA